MAAVGHGLSVDLAALPTGSKAVACRFAREPTGHRSRVRRSESCRALCLNEHDDAVKQRRCQG